MIIVALLAFATLLAAWLVAPAEPPSWAVTDAPTPSTETMEVIAEAA